MLVIFVVSSDTSSGGGGTAFSIRDQKRHARWRWRVCQVEMEGVSGGDGGCVRWRWRVCQVEMEGVSGRDGGCVY